MTTFMLFQNIRGLETLPDEPVSVGTDVNEYSQVSGYAAASVDPEGLDSHDAFIRSPETPGLIDFDDFIAARRSSTTAS